MDDRETRVWAMKDRVTSPRISAVDAAHPVPAIIGGNLIRSKLRSKQIDPQTCQCYSSLTCDRVLDGRPRGQRPEDLSLEGHLQFFPNYWRNPDELWLYVWLVGNRVQQCLQFTLDTSLDLDPWDTP